jgi:protein-S-isoprenylcysteine O-methyltransferase Ste14
VRHPMYGGVLLLVLAWALASSPVALAPGSAGVVFLGVKVRREEELLREEFADYDDYARDVPKRFVPYVV